MLINRIVTASSPDTVIEWAAEYGSYGAYETGYEYATISGVYHPVLRPLRVETFLGYALDGDTGMAVTKISYDGAMSEWRYRNASEERVIARPAHPPLLNLPDEDHGHSWGDPVRIQSDEPTRWFHVGKELSAAAAAAAMAEYAIKRLHQSKVQEDK
jgi:hypothetical protein